MARTIPTPEVNGEALRLLANASCMSESDVFALTCLAMIDRHINDKVLYWGKAGCEDSAGRRYAMAPRHMLFMYLEYAKGGMSQECVANAYGISQTSATGTFRVCRRRWSACRPPRTT